MKNHRLIAIYLPQFHPFKENDEWWGKGFTEWTNVTKAHPRFPGHYQPHLPADLGFYDLRIPEVREQQAQMAKEAGIYGFCYYHYWFNGHQLMHRPLEEILKSGKPNFPFMLCWANENWARTWDGGKKDILIKQEYSEDDDRNHIRFLIKNYFKDSRYIKVDGKPVFCIYRYKYFPNISKTIEIWREEAKLEDLELYLIMVEAFDNQGPEGISFGFDAALEFQPHGLFTNGFFRWYDKFLSRNINKIFTKLFGTEILPTLVSYKKYVNYIIKKSYPDYKIFPGITPGWDNACRRIGKPFFAMVGNNPKLYGKWLDHIVRNFIPYSKEENFIFINAWNEWAEGNHLEPDRKWGNAFLEETKRVLNSDKKNE